MPAVVTSVVVWVTSLIGNSATYRSFTVKSVGTNAIYRYCGVDDAALSVTVLAFFLLGYALPLVVITALYVLIACHVRRHRLTSSRATTSVVIVHHHHHELLYVRRHRRRVTGPPRGVADRQTRPAGHRNARTLKLVVIVVVVFGISWLPIHLQSLAGYFGFHSPEGAVYEVFRVIWNCMAYSNSCANPFIYHCRPSGGAQSAARLGRRQRQYAAGDGRVLPLCCQSTSSFTSTVGRHRGHGVPISQRTRTTYLTRSTSFRRTRRIVEHVQPPVDTHL